MMNSPVPLLSLWEALTVPLYLVPVYGGQVPEARQVLPYYWSCVLNSQRPGGAGTVANNVKPVLDVALGYTLKHEFTFFNNAH